jgi:hypothetical protein
MALLLVALVAGCSSSSGGGTSPSTSGSAPSGSGSTTAAVSKTWVTFFAGTTPAAAKILLLQNGQQFSAVIQAQATSPLAKSAGAKVTSVTQTSPTTAQVHYSILLGGQPALQNQVGVAVLVGGTWRVGVSSFCALLSLEGSKVPACPATG